MYRPVKQNNELLIDIIPPTGRICKGFYALIFHLDGFAVNSAVDFLR